MKLTYAPKHDIACICFHDKQADVESLGISDGLVVDLALDETVYGIEFLNANKQLQSEDMGELVVVNEATGQYANLPLTRAEMG